MSNSEYALRGRDLSFSFGAEPVLEGVNVALRWGAVTAIAGPNGAGKSTLLELLAGVRKPSKGTVVRTHEVALVVQRVNAPDTLPLTVRDVVAMGTWGAEMRPWGRRVTALSAAERRARVAEALDRVELADHAAVPFNALSGGQRQRALLAQGMARRARIFLLDEPAAGLDAQSRDRARAMLAEEARRGAAVACVSHEREAIAAADEVVHLDGGRVLVPGRN